MSSSPSPHERRSRLAPIAESGLEQYGVFGSAKAVSIDSIDGSPRHIAALREAGRRGNLHCLLCQQDLELVAIAAIEADAAPGYALAHPDGQIVGHEPETIMRRRGRRLLRERLEELFTTATIDEIVAVSDDVTVDALVLTGHGGKLAVILRHEPCKLRRHERILHELERQGIALLWLGVAEGLARTPIRLTQQDRRAGQEQMWRITLDETETALVAAGRPLWYLQPKQRSLLLVHPHPQAVELVQSGMLLKLGSIECALREYPISQLRVSAGMVAVLDVYDPPLPAFAALPKRLVSRYAGLVGGEATARQQALYVDEQ